MRQNLFITIGASLAMLFLFATGAFAAMGDVQNFTFNGFGPTDVVSAGEVDQPDGNPDARFSATISGVGALSGLVLRSEEDGAVWDTTPGNQIWGMQVKDSSGNMLTGSSGRLSLVPFIMGLNIEFSVADNGTIARGGRFTLTARFIDNSESSATLTVQPSYTTSTSSRLNLRSVRWEDKGPRDLTGKNESFRGDGNDDDHIRIELDGKGTLVSVELRNIVNGNPTAAWDTIPNNGRWALAVAQGNNILNRYDGSVQEYLSGRTTLDLWMSDNGTIASGNHRFEVVLRFSDGHYLTGFVDNRAGQGWDQSKGLEAAFAGEGDRDLVGRGEARSGNGKSDWRVDVNIEPSGIVIGMKITNVEGPAGIWDTVPGNGKWLLAVTKPNGNILNRSDGSVDFDVSRSGDLVLWMENNGSLNRKETRSILTVIYDDGRVLETEIEPYSNDTVSSLGEFRDASLEGTKDADYVGRDERLRGNQERDSRFDIRFRAKGILTAIHLVNLTKGGEWDTIPNNGKWLIAVKQPGGSVLNASNGSVKLSVDGTASLELWVEDNGTLGDKASAFRISLDFSDGSTLEKDISARKGGSQLEVDNNDKRELDLSKPRKASSSDYVGPYDRLSKNGAMDWYFNLKIKGKGTIKAMTLKNIGASGEWDTIPGNGRWTLAVRGDGNRILNNSNGSVSFRIPPEHNVYLFVENNGTLQLSKSSYELVVTWADGTKSTAQVH